jgi:3-phosphoshikimate 1-carboxyvinyltransferase
MMRVVGGHGITATFDGDASLRKRPTNRILDPLKLMSAQVLSQGEGGQAPLVRASAKGPATCH